MKIERWDPERHMPMLAAWHIARGLAPDAGPADMYPPTGAVADDCAAAFLYRTDAPGVAYLDNLMTDPAVSREQRSAAVEALFACLSAEARSLGVRLVSAVTRSALVRDALEEVGFRPMDSGLTWLVRMEA